MYPQRPKMYRHSLKIKKRKKIIYLPVSSVILSFKLLNQFKIYSLHGKEGFQIGYFPKL